MKENEIDLIGASNQEEGHDATDSTDFTDSTETGETLGFPERKSPMCGLKVPAPPQPSVTNEESACLGDALGWMFASVFGATGERLGIFASNAQSMLLGLMLGMRDLSAKGEVSLCEADVRKCLDSDQFIKIAVRDDISPDARDAMQSFLVSMGWKEGVSDRSKWGDFNRQYSYAQNYVLHLLNAIMKVLSEQQRKTETGYETPSRRLSLLVEGRDYLKYRETFERVLFAEKMTPAQKDAKILQLALACLVERMDDLSAKTGEPFVKAEMLVK